MIYNSEKQIYFVDFGLGEYSSAVEEKAVDLHLMRRALESSHYLIADECLDAIFKGYKEEVGEPAKEIFERVKEIRKRGRYGRKIVDD